MKRLVRNHRVGAFWLLAFLLVVIYVAFFVGLYILWDPQRTLEAVMLAVILMVSGFMLFPFQSLYETLNLIRIGNGRALHEQIINGYHRESESNGVGPVRPMEARSIPDSELLRDHEAQQLRKGAVVGHGEAPTSPPTPQFSLDEVEPFRSLATYPFHGYWITLDPAVARFVALHEIARPFVFQEHDPTTDEWITVEEQFWRVRDPASGEIRVGPVVATDRVSILGALDARND